MSTWTDPPTEDQLEAMVRAGLGEYASAVQVRPALHRIWARIRHREVWTTPCCGITNPCALCGSCMCHDRLPRCPGGCQR